MNGLDKRLSEIVSNLKPGDRVADVGSDHGKVAVAAVKITENRGYFRAEPEKSGGAGGQIGRFGYDRFQSRRRR